MDKPPEIVSVEFLRHQNAKLLEQLETTHRDGGSGGGPYMPDMRERLGHLEGEVGGLKHAQNMTIGGLGLIAALVAVVVGAVVGFGIYELQKIDQVDNRIAKLNDKVNELPGRISSDLRDITKTLADVIIATKQTQQSIPPKR